MKVGRTVLSVYSILFFLIVLVYTLLNYKDLSAHEGWGMVAMLGLGSIAVVLFIVDRILVFIIKQEKIVNAVGMAIALTVTFLIMKGWFTQY